MSPPLFRGLTATPPSAEITYLYHHASPQGPRRCGGEAIRVAARRVGIEPKQRDSALPAPPPALPPPSVTRHCHRPAPNVPPTAIQPEKNKYIAAGTMKCPPSPSTPQRGRGRGVGGGMRSKRHFSRVLLYRDGFEASQPESRWSVSTRVTVLFYRSFPAFHSLQRLVMRA